MATNYAALGEYTAFSAQARDAVQHRYTMLNNLGSTLVRAAQRPDETVDIAAARRVLDDYEAAGRELEAALTRANQAAALCGKPALDIHALLRMPFGE